MILLNRPRRGVGSEAAALAPVLPTTACQTERGLAGPKTRMVGEIWVDRVIAAMERCSLGIERSDDGTIRRLETAPRARNRI